MTRAAADTRHISPGERVVIIGAGPAGLHAAHLLARRGVDDVTILERRGRVGGKAWTIAQDGVEFELGTCFLHNRYVETRRLIAEMGLGPSRPMWGGSVIVHDDFSDLEHQAVGPTLRYLWRFARLRRRYLGRETTAPARRPSPAQLDALAVPAAQFFRDHGLFPTLERNFKTAFSAQGYGYLEEIPALYPLIWFEPKVLRAVVVSTAAMPLRGPLPGLWKHFSVTHVLADGFGRLMQRLADGLPAKIHLGATVDCVRRDPCRVEWTDAQGAARVSDADRVIWAAPIAAAAGVFADATETEQAWFAHQTSTTLTVTAYADAPVPDYTAEGAQCLYFQDRTDPTSNGRWFADRDDGAIRCPDPARTRDLRLAYQYDHRPIDDPEAGGDETLARLRADWQAAGRSEARPVEREGRPLQVRWSYFPRFDAAAVRDGLHWQVLDAQGHNRTFWLGSSVWFESVEHVLRYNRAVLG